jgi:selenoprotein W-related protein
MPRAVSLVSELLEDKPLEAQISSLDLIPATGGKFEVTVNGELLFSKKALGRHAEPGEVYQLIKSKAI